MKTVTVYIIIFLMAIIFLGCSKRYRLEQAITPDSNDWQFYHKDLSATNRFDSEVEPLSFQIKWEHKENDKIAGPLTVYDKTLFYPGSRKKIQAFDIVTGKNRGKIKTKAAPQTGLVISDSLGFFAVAPRKNHLYGYDLTRKKRIWQRKLKDAARGSIIIDNSLIVSSGDGILFAIDTETGDEIWRFDGEGRFVAPASFNNGKLLQPSDRGILYAIDFTNGEKIYETDLKEPIVSAATIDDHIYVTTMPGGLFAIDFEDGSVLWEQRIDKPIWTSPVIANGNLFIGHSLGEILSFDAKTGRQQWRYETSEVVTASPIWLGGRVIAGTKAGTLLMLDDHTGELIAKEQVNGGIKFSPVTDGKHILVATTRGRIICFGVNNEQKVAVNHGVDSQEESK